MQCLLLEDLDEVARYQGAANGAPAEIRIFKSNLAVLPLAGTPFTSPTPRSTSNLASSATPSAARKLPDLRALRAAYLGRAIHSSLETWSS